MVPRSMSLGQQYKISPPETEPPLTPLLTSPILSLGLFHITLLDLPDMLAQIEEWGWLDGFFFFPPVCLSGLWLCASVGTCRGKSRGQTRGSWGPAEWSHA